VGNRRGSSVSSTGRAATKLATRRHGTLGSWNIAWARVERRLQAAVVGQLRHGPAWHRGQKGAAGTAWRQSDFGVCATLHGRDASAALVAAHWTRLCSSVWMRAH
jgi:hypothetical protein